MNRGLVHAARRLAAGGAVAMLVGGCTAGGGSGSTPRAGTGAGGSAGAPGRPVIRVASFDFPESVVLGQLYGQALASARYPVRFVLNAGPREILEPALQQGFVDFLPEYAGSALEFVGLGAVKATADSALTHDALVRALAPRGVDVLAAAPAEDKNGVALRAADARRLGVRTLSGLAPFASGMTFGGPPGCAMRPLCLKGLSERYHLKFSSVVELDAGGPYTVAALEDKDVDAALLFTTNGAIQSKGFVILRDDKGLQPAENVTPVVRRDILAAAGRPLEALLDGVSSQLTTADVTAMNSEVAAGGSPASVAAAWLEEHGYGR